MMRFLGLIVGVAAFFALVCADIAVAQTSRAAKEHEEAEIREALRTIAASDPDRATEAQKALDALDKPASSPEGRQTRNRRERGSRRIVNGLTSRSHPAVGALLKGSSPQSAGAWCTGTLVGCDKFLTAAHCIAGDPSPGSYLVFFQELGFRRVTDIRWEKEKYDFPYFDLAMLTLDDPVEGIAPMPINMSVTPLNNSVATIVGFGRTGGTRFDYGLKREGTVRTSACPDSLAKSNVLCWRFDADVISNASAQNTCNADSGGGIFMRDGPQRLETVFGVVSGGTDSDCLKNDLSYNADVFQYRDWIAAAGEGRLSSVMCGKPLWAGADPAPIRKTLRLSPSRPEAAFTIEVPDGLSALHVAMNGEDDGQGKNLFRLSVFSGNSQRGSETACKDDEAGQFAFCAIDKPKSGLWTVALRREKGEGEAQVTTLLVRR